ncbi:MAG: hypothetical protein HY902_03040 [Deltaproteobacteria bacterium]|nr:hypothetical protein [Deltaproteobacteria bacterium]
MRIAHLLPALVLTTSACVTANQGGGGGGTAVVTSGGAVGSTCPKEDQIGCAPGATGKVRCKNAVWVSDGACKTGETCIETKSGDSVTATQCTVPPTARVDRAITCAKASHCLSGSFSTCMNPMPIAVAQKISAVTGLAEAKQLLYYGIDSYASCIKAAKDCAAVEACVKSGTLDCSASQATCNGSKLVYCEGKTPTAVDCAAVGLPCATVTSEKGGSIAVCAKTSPCSSPKTLSCSGAIAKACMAGGNGQNFAIEMNCGLIGGTCDANAPFDDDPDACVMPGNEACDDTSFAKSCVGNVANTCKNGKVAKLDCSLIGMTCQATTDSSGKTVSAGCKLPGSCPTTYSPVPSEATTVQFCEGGSYASFDCALAGMEYSGYECQFPGEGAP